MKSFLRILGKGVLTLSVSLFSAYCLHGQSEYKLLNLLEYIGDFEDDNDPPDDPQHGRHPQNGIANWWSVSNGVLHYPHFEFALHSNSPKRGLRYQRVGLRTSPTQLVRVDLGSHHLHPGTWVPGRYLRVSLWVRSAPNTVRLKWKIWSSWQLNPSGQDEQRDIVTLQEPPGNEWRHFVGEVVPPPNADRLKFWIHVEAASGATGALHFDDMRVEDLTLLPPPLEKPIKLFWMYQGLDNWIDSARKADAVGHHKFHFSGAHKHFNPGFLNLHWVRVAYMGKHPAEAPYYSLENLFDRDWLRPPNKPEETWPRREWLLRLRLDGACERRVCDQFINMDLGSEVKYNGRNYREEILYQLQKCANTEHWDALLLDYFHFQRELNNTCSQPGQHVKPCDYETDAIWQAAVTRFLQALQPLRDRGIKLIPNMGLESRDGRPWSDWIPLVDGFIIEWGFVMQHAMNNECFIDYYDQYGGNVWWQSWRNKFLMLQASETTNPPKLIMINHRLKPDGSAAYNKARRFALASYLCAMTNHTYFGLSTMSSDCVGNTVAARPIWHDDFAVPLGKPRGSFKLWGSPARQHGDLPSEPPSSLPTAPPPSVLLTREFENGLVVLNPHKDNPSVWFCPRLYYCIDGKRYDPRTYHIGPREALILLVPRPKVEVEIQASQSNVFPGGLLTYTVRYANVGHVEAQNVQVRAPLPSFCSFVSASDGGRLQGNEVFWNIGTVRAGGSGTRTFTVRVN